jgi:hypothetical protein
LPVSGPTTTRETGTFNLCELKKMEAKTKRELELEEFLRNTYWTLRTYLVSHASAADWAHKAVQLQEKIDAILGEGLAVAYGGGVAACGDGEAGPQLQSENGGSEA